MRWSPGNLLPLRGKSGQVSSLYTMILPAIVLKTDSLHFKSGIEAHILRI